MKILVTGGAGFIGRHLVESLSENHSITIYDNLSNSTKPSFENIDFVKGDILDCDTLEKSSKGFDGIIHLAAKSDVTESVIHPEETMNVNVNGTQNVLKVCVQNKIKKIIFASSAAVYGEHDEIITEESKTNPLSPYGKSKLQAEEKIKIYSKKYNLDAIVFRMFNVYGKGQTLQYAGVITKFAENILQNIPLTIYGDGRQTRDFISIDDVVEAYHCALDNNQEKKSIIYNLGTGVETSITHLAKLMIEISGKNLEINYVDGKKGDINHSVADVALAKNELGFVAKTKLREGLTKI
ncbi:NAD-dependent epimerase/dehydratase family protein [Nitrosopumilus sp. b2]|uniref:NAD-dependent epimerase/dehydratase family protein n=1 Tax=Nitrosopumilus sp. b2 TaxID=2109908 RepID=UPI0015F70631|nr:NAD-dependent epimerase/dehydratase family protein [Nitrosopumilus sp. b2]KAF6245742.1 NAD-dependent dehydratase [Nitrosopumilus sp. b2]